MSLRSVNAPLLVAGAGRPPIGDYHAPMTANIVILTGAGISAESGLGTFRDKDGLWTRVDLAEVATPQAFARDPARVHAFYNSRRVRAAAAQPNAAHAALARLEAAWRGEFLLVTQNVDDLHFKAGNQRVLPMHGQLGGAVCAACGHRWKAPDEMAADDPCPACAAPATRPDIVWFGEMPLYMDRIIEALSSAHIFVAIGTSGAVYPAAGFAAHARAAGAETLELNLQPSDVATDFAQGRYGKASELVPAWVDEFLGC